jgi:para-nitrobenzyl esterase
MSKIALRYLLVFLFFSMYLSIAKAAIDTIHVSQGSIVGTTSSNGHIIIYKGIPYAAPPIGKLRWREPQAPEPWQGTLIADSYGRSAMQTTSIRNPWTAEFINAQPISEDCLYLNIWAPKRQKQEKLAVLVYIHGGGYTEGSGSTSITDGENLAERGIVVITINYRLGIFGFFAHPELTSESVHHSSGNYGLMDQLAALKWIHDNVSAFGGDPKRVTICGQSAGAGCVHDLIVSPITKGLIKGGIAESGSDLVPRTPMLTLSQAEKACSEFVATTGLSLQQLRALPADELLTYTKNLPGVLRPIIDGWFLPESVPARYRERKQNDVPILTGINADEGSAKSNYGKVTVEEFKKQSIQLYGNMCDEFNRLYASSTDVQAAKAQIESARDYGLASTYFWAKAYIQSGHSHAYTYFFNHPIPWPQFPQYGVFHSSEIPYVFHNLNRLNRPWELADKQLEEIMTSYWINFINSGNPNGVNLPAWPEVNPNLDQTLYIDSITEAKAVLPANKLHFFQRFFNKHLVK